MIMEWTNSAPSWRTISLKSLKRIREDTICVFEASLVKVMEDIINSIYLVPRTSVTGAILLRR